MHQRVNNAATQGAINNNVHDCSEMLIIMKEIVTDNICHLTASRHNFIGSQ